MKTLRRIPKITPLPNMDAGLTPDSFFTVRPKIGHVLNSAGVLQGMQGPPSKFSEILSYISSKVREVDLSSIKHILGAIPLKKYGIIGLTVATMAGITYLLYKFFKGDITYENTIGAILSDLKKTAPGLFKIEGWLDMAKKEIKKALDSGSPAEAIKGILNIKSSVIGKGMRMGGGIGAGLDYFTLFPKDVSGEGIRVAYTP